MRLRCGPGKAAGRLTLIVAAVSTLALAACTSESPPTTSRATATPAPTAAVTPSPTPIPIVGLVPSGLGNFLGLSCPTVSACVAVGGSTEQVVEERTGQATAVFSRDGGASWTKSTVPVGLGPLNGVSCPSAVRCVAVGGIGSRVVPTPGGPKKGGFALFSKNGGASWSKGKVPAGSGPLSAVSCPTPRQCLAVGPGNVVPNGTNSGGSGPTALFSANGGASWATIPVPSGVGAFYGVSCPTTGNCVTLATGPLGGAVGLLSADGGAATSSSLFGEIEPDNDSDDNTSGSFSTTLPKGMGTVQGISCGSVRRCAAVASGAAGTTGIFSHDGGSKWASAKVPRGAGFVAVVSCPTTSACVAIGRGGSPGEPNGPGGPGGSAVLFSTNGGASWSLSILPSGLGDIYSAVSCVSANLCTAIATRTDGVDVALTSPDGGATWSFFDQ
jgi:hypothetical protein